MTSSQNKPISAGSQDNSATAPCEAGLRSGSAYRIADVVEVSPARGEEVPVLLSSPHSGRYYETELCDQTMQPHLLLRRSEDAYVDQLIETAPDWGAMTVSALFPRVFVDVNRARWELDPDMFRERLPDYVDTQSPRALSGLGVVPRIAADGRPLYRSRLRFSEVERRISRYYTPYHDTLTQELERLKDRFGFVILLDVHSMPSRSARGLDFVLGDRHGQSCSPDLVSACETLLRAREFVTVRNTPYAGGHTTEAYGRPDQGVHVLQLEINRGLYLDENQVVMRSVATRFCDEFPNFIKDFCQFDWTQHLSSY